jgi:hypothetical protein
VPVIAEPETVPVPVAVVEHPAYAPSNPPAGTDSENCSVEPDTVPDTVPRPLTLWLASTIVNVPENDDPV